MNPNEVIQAAQMMLASNLPESQVISFLQTYKLKLTIRNGRIIDESDACETYLDKFITGNKEMLELKDDIRKLANEPYEVLIIGPTGTGKELLAQALQGRRQGRFVAINCAGLPEQLVESELFGHERGAFTGATTDKLGLFRSAEKDGFPGTIFLDEISELPMPAQGKLLRALQTKHVRPVGGRNDVPFNCRVVCAANRRIDEMCANHTFRTDLYARIGTFEFHTKSLAERGIEDIVAIYKAFGADNKYIDYIYNYITSGKLEFPFNVRSIQAHIKRFKVLGKYPI